MKMYAGGFEGRGIIYAAGKPARISVFPAPTTASALLLDKLERNHDSQKFLQSDVVEAPVAINP